MQDAGAKVRKVYSPLDTGKGHGNPAFASRQEKTGPDLERPKLKPEEEAHCSFALENYKHLRNDQAKIAVALDSIGNSFDTICGVIEYLSQKQPLSRDERDGLAELSKVKSQMIADLRKWSVSEDYGIRSRVFSLITAYQSTIEILADLINGSPHEDTHKSIVSVLADKISNLRLQGPSRKRVFFQVKDQRLEEVDYYRWLILRVGVHSRFTEARNQAITFFTGESDSPSLDCIATTCPSTLDGFEKTRTLANTSLKEVQAQVREMGGRGTSFLRRYVYVTPSHVEAGSNVVPLRRAKQEPDPGTDGGAAVALPKPDEGEREFKEAA